MGIGNLGMSELLVVAVLVLLLFGPRKLPEIGRTVGQALRELRRGMNEVKRELEEMERTSPPEEERRGGGPPPSGRIQPPGTPDEPDAGTGGPSVPDEDGPAEDRRHGSAARTDAGADADAAGPADGGEESPGADADAADRTG